MTSLVRRLGARLPDVCLVSLRLAGWVAVTSLAAAGCLVLGFAMLGGFTADGFFAHLDNLASRFAGADAARRASFLSLAQGAGLTLLALVASCRWRSLRGCLVIPKEPDHG